MSTTCIFLFFSNLFSMIWYFHYISILAFLWWSIVCSSNFQHRSKFAFVHDWYHIVCQVQWDEPSSIMRPERVSHWELEPLVATTPSNSQPVQRNKRARPYVIPSPTADLSALGLSTFHFVFPRSICLCWFLVISFLLPCALGMWKSPVESSALSYGDSQRGRDLYSSPNFSTTAKVNSLGFRGNSQVASVSHNSMHWPNRVESVTDSFAPVVNKDSGERRQGTGIGYKLFGIQLVENSNTEGTSPVVVSGTVVNDLPVLSLEAESDQHSEPEKSCLRSSQELQSRQIRSCTKVTPFWLFYFFIRMLCTLSFSSFAPLLCGNTVSQIWAGII